MNKESIQELIREYGMPMIVAVIGTGRVGERHARALYQLGQPFLSLFDTDTVRSVNLARSLRSSAFAYEKLEIALRDARLVYVCTPFTDHLHMEPIRLAAEQGSAIFCEKPMTDNLEDAYEIQRIVQQSNVPFVVGNYHLLNRPIEILLGKFNHGEIGQARELDLSYKHDMTQLFAVTGWRNPENYLYDAGVHPVDMALLIAGEDDPVSTVSATWEGDYILSLGFKSGMPAKIRISYRPQKRMEEINSGVGLRIIGTRGMLEATSLGSTVKTTKEGDEEVLEVPQGSYPLPVDRVAELMAKLIFDIACGKTSSYDPLPGVDRALKSIQVLAAAEKSIKNRGAAITLSKWG